MGNDYRFRKNHCSIVVLFFHFFLKVEPIVTSSGILILIKDLLLLGEQIFSFNRNLLQKLSSLMRVKHYCVLQKQVVKSKTLFQLTQIKFLASENHSFQFSQIPYSENTFLNKSFIPASGKLFSLQWKHYTFVVCSEHFCRIVKHIFQRMLHSWQWRRIFWLVQTIFYKFFQRFLPGRAFFLSSVNVLFNESFIPAIGERFSF